jgi:predicted transcriptional regulator
MDFRIGAEAARRLSEISARTGRDPSDLLEDALPYLEELAQVRGTLDARYDDLATGRVVPMAGEAFFETLRVREEGLAKDPPE